MDYSESANKRNRRRQHPHATRLRNTVGVLIFRVLFAAVLIGAFAVAGAGIGIYLGILRNAPEINITTDIRPGTYNSIIIEARTGAELARLSGEENREFVAFDRMPEHLVNAFIAIEDERFMSHNGVDIRSMARALRNNLTTDTTEGASTITQQLIKNMLGLVRNDFVSKLQEQYLAVQFERELTEVHGSREIAKEVILEAYLNMINLGRDWHGVQMAAWNYFGKDVADLTISESAVIAAITRHPWRYQPCRNPENNRYRQLLVLDKMLELEMITERQFREAVNDPVHDRIQRDFIDELASGITHTWFVEAVIEQVVEDLQREHFMTEQQAFALVYGGGLRIYTTFDQRIQDIVDEVFLDDEIFPVDIFEIDIEYHIQARNVITGEITNHRRTGTVRTYDQVIPWRDATREELLTANDTILSYRYILMPQPQAAFVIMDHHNGHVLAISGGRGEKVGNRHFCRATVATRSPGSQFKVVAAFLPGVDRGIFSAAYSILDEPWTFDDGHSPPWTPANWWQGGHEGHTTVRRAIYRSANVASAIAFQQVGAEVAFDYLRNLGFTTLEGTLRSGAPFRDMGASVPLGGLTLGVTQLELAAAYATIANLGEYHRPVFYTRVLDHNGRLLLENGHNPVRVISAQAAYLLTDMMRDTVRGGPGGATGMRANFPGMPIAGKTGTSQNVEDLGFTGYTPYFTAAIWLGYDRPRTLPRGNAHLDIWRNIMERVHTELGLERREFIRPEGVVTGSICRVSNMLPTDLCRRAGTVVTDLFVVGTLPVGHCEGHPAIEQWLCALSGLPISDYCPEDLWVMGTVLDCCADLICMNHGPFTPGFPDGGFWFPDLPGFPGLPQAPDSGFQPGDGFWDFNPPLPAPEPTPDVPWWQEPEEVELPTYNFPQPGDSPEVDYGPPPSPGAELESLLPYTFPEAIWDDDDDSDTPGWFDMS